MIDFVNILKLLLLNVLPSIGDNVLNVLNGLDMVGYNSSSAIINTVTSTATDTFGLNISISSTTTNDSTYREDVIWGYLAIALIFAPGIPTAIAFIINGVKDASNWCFAILALPCYPVFMFMAHLVAFCIPDMDDWIVALAGWEAFFESHPQMILQLFTIQYGYPVTAIQIATIFLSFLFAAKTSIAYDMPRTMFGNWKEKAFYILCVIPVYTTGIMFRIGAQSVITAYLRYWALLPILIQIGMYTISTWRLGFNKANIPLIMIANLGGMTRGCYGATDAKISCKFLRNSTILTFMYESIILCIILIMTNVDPTLMNHWQGSLIYFHYTPSIVAAIFGVGLLNLLLLFVTYGKLKNPHGKPSKEMDPNV